MRPWVKGGLWVCVGLLAFSAYLVQTASGSLLAGVQLVTPPASRPLAVLGDSDSHSYHDRVSFPASHSQRGGAFHDVTWQWGEVLSKLRSRDIDQGGWGRWGTWWPVAAVQDRLGLGGRSPVKEDFEFNFAQSGAGCDGLIKGRMASRLVKLMDADPRRWARGAVVIRIGINDFGTQEALQALSLDPRDPGVQGTMGVCLDQIRQTVALVHQHHPHTRLVLVGVFDNANWARWHSQWQSKLAKDNIAAGLDRFDRGLRDMVAQDQRLVFFDDRAWFAAHWGGRDEQGRPAYRTVKLGRYEVRNTEGDPPGNATLADGHAGLVWNLLWAQSLVTLLNQSSGTWAPEISDAELVGWLDKNTAGRW